jgi:hypothetical protein
MSIMFEPFGTFRRIPDFVRTDDIQNNLLKHKTITTFAPNQKIRFIMKTLFGFKLM